MTELPSGVEADASLADACLGFIVNGGATVVPSTTSSLGRRRELMRRYDDLPMDFADATLVV